MGNAYSDFELTTEDEARGYEYFEDEIPSGVVLDGIEYFDDDEPARLSPMDILQRVIVVAVVAVLGAAFVVLVSTGLASLFSDDSDESVAVYPTPVWGQEDDDWKLRLQEELERQTDVSMSSPEFHAVDAMWMPEQWQAVRLRMVVTVPQTQGYVDRQTIIEPIGNMRKTAPLDKCSFATTGTLTELGRYDDDMDGTLDHVVVTYFASFMHGNGECESGRIAALPTRMFLTK